MKGWGGKRDNFVKMNLKNKRGKFGKAATWRFTRQKGGNYKREDAGFDDDEQNNGPVFNPSIPKTKRNERRNEKEK